MIYYDGAVRDIVLSETWRMPWFVARTRDSRLPGLLLVIGLRTWVAGRTSIRKGFGSGSEILIVSTIVISSMAIGVRVIRMASSHVVEPVTQICVLERSWWITISMQGHLRHS